MNLCFEINPISADELALSQAIQKAMGQTFGLTRAYTYFDFSKIDSNGKEMVLKVAKLDAPYFKAALAAYSGHRTFSLKDETPIHEEESDVVDIEGDS